MPTKEKKRAALESDEYNPYGYFKSFYKLPREIATIPTQLLSEGAKVLFGVLMSLAGDYGTAYPKIETLSALMGGRDRRTVERWMRELKNIGLIRSKFKGKRLSNNFYFLRSGITGNGTPEENEEWTNLKAKMEFAREDEEYIHKERRSAYERKRKTAKMVRVVEEAAALVAWVKKRESQDEELRKWEEGLKSSTQGNNSEVLRT